MTNPNHTDTSRSDDLKPCPFCGGRAMVYGCPDLGAIVNGTDPGPTSFHVACTSCDGGHPPSYSRGDAIAAWNTRPADRIEALEAEVERLLGLVGEAGDHMAEQITHIETRIADGDEMCARVWRIALEDVARENRATLAKIKENLND